MIPALILACAVAAGMDLRRVALLATAVHLPSVLAVLIAVTWWRSRAGDDERPALFCEVVASELRAGASLRHAMLAAGTSVGGVRLTPDASIPVLAEELGLGFPSIARELHLTVTATARTGADAAVLFDEIGSLALAQAETRREVRVATAPGRATALVLVVAPLLYIVSRLTSGGLEELLAAPHQRVAAVGGLGLFLAGLAIASLMLWRSGR